jgi:hypothetical protein
MGPNTNKATPLPGACQAVVREPDKRRTSPPSAALSAPVPESFPMKTREVSGRRTGAMDGRDHSVRRTPQIRPKCGCRGVPAPRFSQEACRIVAPCKGSGHQWRSPSDEAVTPVHSGGYIRRPLRLESGGCGTAGRAGSGVVVLELPPSAKALFLNEDTNIQGGSDGR